MALAVVLVQAAVAQPLTITTLAGPSESPGWFDGTGSAARFYKPYGVAVDSSGNIFVADTNNHTIRKVTPAGVVTTLAGLAGSDGSTDGTSSAARFTNPNGVAVDGNGNVYVADTANYTIRKITPTGVVTTLAGLAGDAGSADGTGSTARFTNPTGIAVDSGGNVYVADSGNDTIRKITPAGLVTTLAGTAQISGSADGTGSAARFLFPNGIAADSSGNVYVADTGNCTIRKITPAGDVSTLAGTAGSVGSADGTGGGASFSYPYGVAVDAGGNVYVADTDNHTIRKITPAGVVTTFAGTAGSSGSADGTGSAARFFFPNGIAADSSGNVYVADTQNHTIRSITSASVVTTLAGVVGGKGTADGAGGAARFNMPYGVAVDSAGNIYVADTDNHTIRKITPAGAVTTFAGTAGSSGSTDGNGSAARFYYPWGLAVDTSDTLYVADMYNHTIRKITPTGDVTTLAGTAGINGSADGTGAAARFYSPYAVAVDAGGNVYVADTYAHTIRKITPAAVVTTLAGTANSEGSADGTGAAARFWFPSGVAVDAGGNVYVADTYNHTIRMITPAGVVTTVAGAAGTQGSADGTGSAARFSYPYGIAIGSGGNLYVSDSENFSVRRVTPAGVVTTVAGAAGVSGFIDGTGSAARFSYPTGVAVDSSGNFYFADASNHSIRKGVPSIADVATIDSATSKPGALRQLDTAPQTATSWQWSVVLRPSASIAALSSTSIRNPTFTPDMAGTYVFRLQADSPSGASITFVTLAATQAGKSKKSKDDGCSTGTDQSTWLALVTLFVLTMVSFRRFGTARDQV